MYLSSRNNQFKFEFPRKFIPDEIIEKYKPFINKIPGNMLTEPIDMFNYGIQSLNITGISYTPTEQIDYPGITRRHRSPQPTQELYDKNLQITMQSFSGFINYWIALDLFTYYYRNKEAFLPEGVGLQILDGEGNVFVTIRMMEMLMTELDPIDFDFSSNSIEFNTFNINFAFNVYEIVINTV